MKTTKIIYWSLHTVFALFMAMDAIAGITYNEEGIKALTQLHYPIYIMPVIGVLKLLGAIVLLVPGPKTLKEWAYAGFTFNFLLAAISWACVKGPAMFVLLPLIVMTVLMTGYYCWKKLQALKPIA
jgi:hypothetical protein